MTDDEQREETKQIIWIRAESDGGYVHPFQFGDLACPGITIRDHFAGLAMAAIIGKMPHVTEDPGRSDLTDLLAMGAYDYADSMLAARK